MCVTPKQYGFWKNWTGNLKFICIVAIVTAFAVQATAELTQVQVGGHIRIRGRYYGNNWQHGRAARIPNDQLMGRPIGYRGTQSLFKWDSRGSDWTRYESAVLLNVKANFTEDVSAFIELYDFHIWGEEFRSNYLTGADSRHQSVGDVLLHQGYIEMRKLFDQPLRLRIGRQELFFGKGFLVSNLIVPSQFISFDALRLTYAVDNLVVDAFASKLNENNPGDDDDVDFYGVYGTYSGFAPLNISAYYFYLHDQSEIARAENTQLGRWINDWRGYDYSTTQFHTVGTRLFGKYEGFDYDLEVAYQFGKASHLGSLFKNTGSNFGDTDARYDNWAIDAKLGYTFRDTMWQPRIYMQGVLLQGEDNRDISFGEWLNPFRKPEASVSFNRLFTHLNYAPTVNDNSWLSNFYQASAGVEIQPTAKIRMHFHVAYDWVCAPFASPRTIGFAGRRIPIAPSLGFWTDDTSNDVGWEIAAWMKYHYSEDLWFMLYGNYLWPKEALTRGSFMHFNGTEFSGGSGDSESCYLVWMAVLKF
ncbi:MAG: alginate export family protein [Candidatus Hydrogenedentes bacterium]|nr:alginate export family protein [Candidatus Hydrogenedentota bacterium]